MILNYMAKIFLTLGVHCIALVGLILGYRYNNGVIRPDRLVIFSFIILWLHALQRYILLLVFEILTAVKNIVFLHSILS